MPFHLHNKHGTTHWRLRMCNGVLLPKFKNLVRHFGRNSVCTWKVWPHLPRRITHSSYLTGAFVLVIQRYKVMRSRTRTCSSLQAPYLPKAWRGCRQSTMTWKLLSVFVPVPFQPTELFIYRPSAFKSDISADRRCHTGFSNARSRTDGDRKIYRRSGGAFQGFKRAGYRPGNIAR